MIKILILGAIIISGCTPSMKAISTDKNKPIVEAALDTAPPSVAVNGNLWGGTSSNMFSDPKGTNVGDLVTILVSEKSSATRTLGTKKDRSSTLDASINTAFGLELGIAKNPNLTPTAGISSKKSFAGSGSTNNSDVFTTSLTATITKVFRSGNLEVRGRKMLIINQQPQAITFVGIIRPVDIQANNTITSDKVAQAVISYGGGGELATVAHEGWLSNTLEQIWPF